MRILLHLMGKRKGTFLVMYDCMYTHT